MRRMLSLGWIGMGVLAVLIAVSSVGCPNRTGTLRVWNNTAKDIVELYCTPTWDTSWGDNLISNSINAGETRDITGFDPDNYDVLAVFEDDSEAEEDDFTLAAGETFTWNVLLSLPSGKSEGAPVVGADGVRLKGE